MLMTIGYPHGLKYAFGPQSYERMVAASINLLTATDSVVAPDADDYYQYNSSQQVSEVVVAGAGASSGGGLGTYVGTGTGDGGDQYVGLDRFGRVVDQKCVNASTSTVTDEWTYDRESNRLYSNNLVNSGFSDLYSYDTENQLSSYQEGTLNSAHTA